MQWLASITAILALVVSVYTAARAPYFEDMEERVQSLENLASRISMDDRLMEVEKWTRGRCVGFTVKKACEEMRVLDRQKLMFPDKQ